MKILGAKAAVDRVWKNLKNLPTWQECTAKSKQEDIDPRHRKRTKQFIFSEAILAQAITCSSVR